MELADHSLALLGTVLLVGLFIPALLERFRVPLASALILVGAVLGPNGFDVVRADQTLTLFAFLGATFQMLLAGFEANQLDLRILDRGNLTVFTFNGLFPALVGAGLGFAFGYSWQGAALTGAIFLSSSVMLVFAFVRHFEIDQDRLGQRLKSAAVLQDLASTLAAFALLKSVDPHERFPLPILIGLVLSAVIGMRMLVPEILAFAFARIRGAEDSGLEQRIRLILAVMLLLLFAYSTLDVPPVVAAFLVGFSMTSIEHGDALRERLHLVGYSLFVPVFLLVLGFDLDLPGLFMRVPGNLVVVTMVAAAIVTKIGGGIVGGRLAGLDGRGALALGLGSSVKLAVPLAATFVALKQGIIGPDLFTAVIVVSVITSMMIPPLLELVLRRRREAEGD